MSQGLRREMGLGGAIVTGLGSILGTGAFVAVGSAAGMWGDAVLIAVPIAGVVAMFNGLSSAYLAGRFPVAGGTYEYAYETLGPWWGFSAGWLFLLAKTASAGTAALGVALYLDLPIDRRLVAMAAVVVVTWSVLSGLRRTIAINVGLVSVTVAALVVFAVAGLSSGPQPPIDTSSLRSGVLPAIAFLFVAYTGYGRIATLGEEVLRPRRTIPIAVVATLMVAGILYGLVSFAQRAAGWGTALEAGLTPADLLDSPFSIVVSVGAVTAMLGVLLNLTLGLSRVWLAMGRRRDMPAAISKLDRRANPSTAILVAVVPILLIALIGDFEVAWSFSALTVLLYYGITNLAALAIDRRRWTSWIGLASCLFLSFFVPPLVWAAGAGMIGLGLLWKAQRRV